MQKRTVVIGDSSIIDVFRIICKREGRTPSKVILGWMLTYIQKETLAARRRNGKKA